MFRNYPLGVMRADFWRYLIVYIFGGFYTDIDTIPIQKFTDWPDYPFTK
jgi:mannosyltransferase OCH1-like enzyme